MKMILKYKLFTSSPRQHLELRKNLNNSGASFAIRQLPSSTAFKSVSLTEMLRPLYPTVYLLTDSHLRSLHAISVSMDFKFIFILELNRLATSPSKR